jgi:F-type H+-transporting ATPase subunit alpha
VVLIFAGTRGYLDAVPVDQIGAYERALITHLRASNPGLLAGIREKLDLKADGLEGKVKAALDAFAPTFAG